MIPPPLSVLYLHSSDDLYGSDRALLSLIRRLDSRRFHPRVLLPADAPFPGPLSLALNQIGVRSDRLAMPVLRRRYLSPTGLPLLAWRMLWARRALRSCTTHQPLSLMHSNTSAVLAGALSANSLGIPHIWHSRELVQRPLIARKLLARMLHRRSTRVIAVSRAVADHLLADQPRLAPRLTVIPDAVDTRRFSPDTAPANLRQAWGVADDETLVGVVGRLSRWKGQDFFLRAFANASRHAPALRAILIGSPLPDDAQRLPALQAQAQRLGIADKVRWPGYLDDMPTVMAALDALVLPSVQPEPFGLVVIEAMASGKPVIATAHGGPAESIVHGETGLLVSPHDPEEMAEALVLLARKPLFRQNLGWAGRKRALRLFGLDAHVRAIENLYMQVLSEKID
ncbi:MAG: hypothetical protein DSY55_06720 [Clostridia bacterium]|nr:MAG: hypothetical protein DSY55_06720 [Clostridia bacterium]